MIVQTDHCLTMRCSTGYCFLTLFFQPLVLFWIWAKLPKNAAHYYRYQVHLENGSYNQNQYPRGYNSDSSRHYSGMVQPLETSSTELIKNNLRSIVFFPQTFLRNSLASFSKRYVFNFSCRPGRVHRPRRLQKSD
jgi:hypothetical protein